MRAVDDHAGASDEAPTQTLRNMIEETRRDDRTFDDLHTALAVYEHRNGLPITLTGEHVDGYERLNPRSV